MEKYKKSSAAKLIKWTEDTSLKSFFHLIFHMPSFSHSSSFRRKDKKTCSKRTTKQGGSWEKRKTVIKEEEDEIQIL